MAFEGRAGLNRQYDLHQRLKLQARNAGISMSELIRQTLEKGIDQDPAASARAFFDSFEEGFLLAATARVHRYPLWTANRKHFPMEDIELIGEAGH